MGRKKFYTTTATGGLSLDRRMNRSNLRFWKMVAMLVYMYTLSTQTYKDKEAFVMAAKNRCTDSHVPQIQTCIIYRIFIGSAE